MGERRFRAATALLNVRGRRPDRMIRVDESQEGGALMLIQLPKELGFLHFDVFFFLIVTFLTRRRKFSGIQARIM